MKQRMRNLALGELENEISQDVDSHEKIFLVGLQKVRVDWVACNPYRYSLSEPSVLNGQYVNYLCPHADDEERRDRKTK